jgi:hypothetical protein
MLRAKTRHHFRERDSIVLICGLRNYQNNQVNALQSRGPYYVQFGVTNQANLMTMYSVLLLQLKNN